MACMPGVHKRQSAFGPPIFSIESGISIKKELIDLNFKEVDGNVTCQFRAEYHITSSLDSIKEIVGQLYGIRSHDIVVIFNGDTLEYDGDSVNLKIIDSLLQMSTYSIEEIKRSIPMDTINIKHNMNMRYKEWDERVRKEYKEKTYIFKSYNHYRKSTYQPFLFADSLSKKPFKIRNVCEKLNTIVVTGTLSPEYNIYSGSRVKTAIVARHPWMNKESYWNRVSVSWILLPVAKWKNVEEIIYTVKYPSHLDMYSNVFFKSWKEYYYQFNKNVMSSDSETEGPDTSSSIEDGVTTLKGTFKNGSPAEITFNFTQPQHIKFYKGGPKLVLGYNVKSDRFAMRYGWESAISLRDGNVLFSLDYDTDYKGENTIALSTSIFSWSLWFIPNAGVGLGLPIDIKREQIGIRFSNEIGYGRGSIAGSYDYYPGINDWQIKIFGQATF